MILNETLTSISTKSDNLFKEIAAVTQAVSSQGFFGCELVSHRGLSFQKTGLPDDNRHISDPADLKIDQQDNLTKRRIILTDIDERESCRADCNRFFIRFPPLTHLF